MIDNYSEKWSNTSYIKYLIVWMALISLIVFSVVLYSFNFGLIGLFFSLSFAFIESILIIKSFMNIKFADLIFKLYLALGVISLLVIFLLVN